MRKITANDIAFNDTLDIYCMGVFNCDAITEKAICISVPTLYSEDKTVWLPKSQITISDIITDKNNKDWKRLAINLPQWLINKIEGE